jgi:DNA-binding LacI/PurR family transcriptional regulator
MMSKTATMRDVARIAGVPVSAVPLVLADKPGVSAERRERVRAAVAQLGYEHRPVRGTPTRRLGLLIEPMRVPALTDVFYGEVIAGIQTEAQRLGFAVWLHVFDAETEGVGDVARAVGTEVDGLIVANGGDITDARIADLARTGVPLVLCDNHVFGLSLHCVVVDNLEAGYLATRHLIDVGHRRIALLPGPRRYRNLVDRQDGYLDALAGAGLSAESALMPPPPVHEERKGEAQMRALLALPERPTAVVAISDKSAMGALAVMQQAGVRVPEEISLASVDDVAGAAATLPPLTPVRVPKREMGALAVRRLLSLLSGEETAPHKIVLYPQLVERQSTGLPPR